MARDPETDASSPRNLFDELLEQFRTRYAEEHGENPPEEVMEEARTALLREVAREKREEHRDIYDALARE
ncbi:hypothetical protein BRC81_10665 [Halobacteriales archaeon QS_1_68_20]|nr:MAG: hypothetical protein BRC81_10665 [Halobacteriales archaeon QS_1_68_20]